MTDNRKKIERTEEYKRKHYDRIAVTVSDDAAINLKILRAHAAAMGESVNGFMLRAVEEAIEYDKRRAVADE